MYLLDVYTVHYESTDNLPAIHSDIVFIRISDLFLFFLNPTSDKTKYNFKICCSGSDAEICKVVTEVIKSS